MKTACACVRGSDTNWTNESLGLIGRLPVDTIHVGRGEKAPREQARVVQLLVERVDYDGTTGKVAITFHPRGIKTLTDILADR